MVTGWSGLPEIDISWTSALPRDVTRNENCAKLPSTVGSGGIVVRRPTHEPATVFSLSKAFCVSEGATFGEAEGMCASDCAEAMVDSDANRIKGTERRGFIVFSSCVIANYNTMSQVKGVLERFASSRPLSS